MDPRAESYVRGSSLFRIVSRKSCFEQFSGNTADGVAHLGHLLSISFYCDQPLILRFIKNLCSGGSGETLVKQLSGLLAASVAR